MLLSQSLVLAVLSNRLQAGFALSLAGLAGLGLLFLFWPQGGFVGRWQRMRELSMRVLIEDALKHLYKAELDRRRPTLPSVAGTLQIGLNRAAEILAEMQRRELVTQEGGELKLSPAGRVYALNMIRAHRLWERHLAEQTGVAEAEWHQQADRYEHFLTPAAANALAAELGHPTHDPHGDPIPTAAGELVTVKDAPLPALGLNQTARIVHMEDEPPAVYAQLVAEGLYPGLTLRLLEVTPQRVRFWSNGDEHILAPIVAANISVVPVTETADQELESSLGLDSLKPGETAQVVRLLPRCRGPERRRLMDLGVLPGTAIRAEMTSPSGDPTAYRVRGAVIALRAEQAGLIQITRAPAGAQRSPS